MRTGFTKEDFYDKLKPNGDCLEWSAGTFNTGYGQTKAYGKPWLTHRLALELEGINTTGHHVLHSCDNPICCNPAHLRLGNHLDNMDDKVSRARQAHGSKHGRAKLTEQDVLQIRAIRGIKQVAIAERYGVSQQSISEIINRKLWAHI